jgi:hypothetical protein
VPAATYALIGYALLIVVIGVLGARKTRSFSDFMLGGRGIGPWMTAFSYGTAYFSAVLFIGFAGKIGWGFGLSGLWIALGNTLVGVLLVWWVLGARIRRVTAEYGVHTLPELLEARYGSRVLKLLTSLAIFVFFIPYSAAVFMGLGYLFTSNFGISYELMILLIGGFTGVYLVLGGYKSMAMIDVIFGIVMTVGVVVLLWSCLDRGRRLRSDPRGPRREGRAPRGAGGAAGVVAAAVPGVPDERRAHRHAAARPEVLRDQGSALDPHRHDRLHALRRARHGNGLLHGGADAAVHHARDARGRVRGRRSRTSTPSCRSS